jgi:hypothetical protein
MTNNITPKNQWLLAIQECKDVTQLIDNPVRTAAAIAFGLSPAYQIVSAIVNMPTCVLKKQLSICDEHSILCSGMKGFITYGSRALTTEQSLLARPFVGFANNVAYKISNMYDNNSSIVKFATPIAIETIESFVLTAGTIIYEAITTNTLVPFADTAAKLAKGSIVGSAIGSSLMGCKNIIPHVKTLNNNISKFLESSDLNEYPIIHYGASIIIENVETGLLTSAVAFLLKSTVTLLVVIPALVTRATTIENAGIDTFKAGTSAMLPGLIMGMGSQIITLAVTKVGEEIVEHFYAEPQDKNLPGKITDEEMHEEL